MKEYKSSEEFIDAFPQWKKELKKLHKILNSTRLIETMKWGTPVYTTKDDKNIVGIGAFKSYVGLWFFQGALLRDRAKLLINAQEEKTKAMRQWRFKSVKEIDVNVNLLKAYIKEAIENSKAGNEIKPEKKGTKVSIPPELKEALSKNKSIKTQYDKLTPFKQREYAEYISEAKREATKQKRIEKILPMIKKGIGLHDKYR